MQVRYDFFPKPKPGDSFLVTWYRREHWAIALLRKVGIWRKAPQVHSVEKITI